MKRFYNRNVIVTGSAQGLGQAIAVELAKEGAKIILVDQNKPSGTAKIIEDLGGVSQSDICDITQEDQVILMAKRAAKFFENKIDILVNNAGFNGKANLIKDMKTKDWEYTLRVNLTGTMMVTREIIPYMIKQKSGIVINISSNVGRRGLPFRSDYVCSKWALLGFTQTLALELVDQNIRVNAVCPGPIEGERIEQLVKMHAEAEGKSFIDLHKAWEDVPMKRFATPEEVTNVVKFLCSDESSAMTGQALNVTCGFIMT